MGYDSYGRTQSDVRHNTVNAETYRADYTYLADSMVATEVIAPAAVAGAGTHSYAYDQAGRLTNWTGPAGSVGYSWDKAGNRLTNGATAFVYDARNRQTSAGGVAQTYTPKGDLLTGGLVHDTFGRLTADGNARYVYDGADRPVTRDLSNGANTDRHTYLAGSTTMTSDGVARYGNSPGGTAATAWRGGATALLLGADRHGDVVTQHAASTGDRTSSRAYDPYGAPTATLNAGGTSEVSSWAGNLGYQSDWTDPGTNRVNMGARWYTPTTATFTTRDTITLPLSTHVDPNRYTYAAANPMKYIDPNGHCYAAADAGSFGIDVPINCADYPDDPKPAPAPAPDITATYAGINEFDSTPTSVSSPATDIAATYADTNEFTPRSAPIRFIPNITVTGCAEAVTMIDGCGSPTYTKTFIGFNTSDPIKAINEIRGHLLNQVGLCRSPGIAALRNSDSFIDMACSRYTEIDELRRKTEELTDTEVQLILIGVQILAGGAGTGGRPATPPRPMPGAITRPGVASEPIQGATNTVRPIGFAPGEGLSALTPGRLQHGTRHLTDAGVLPAWSGTNSPQLIRNTLSPILESPTATFNNALGGTQVKGFIGTVNGQTVAVQVYAEGPLAGQLATAVVPSANQLTKWGVGP